MKGNISWEKLKEKNPGKYPERMGFPWDYDEEFKVLQSVREKKTIEFLSKKLSLVQKTVYQFQSTTIQTT